MADKPITFKVEGARLIFKNFSGKEGPFNQEGERSFGLVLTPELGEQLLEDGWNVKVLEAREEGDEDTPWLPVDVKFNKYPPRIILLADEGKVRTQLTEDTVATVDSVDIENVDLIVRAYTWGPIQGKSGIKAYLQTMFIMIHEDDLEKKYRINRDPGRIND